MNALTIVFSICALAAVVRARPGIGHTELQAIPDLQTYSSIMYPKNHIIHLGEYSKGFLPGDTIHEAKYVTVKEPHPYPVKIPVPHPYPVHISKPYPIVQTKYVPVPHAVPYEIVKQVPIPVEVPKPYPVQVHGNSHGDSYGAGSNLDHGYQGEAQNYVQESNNYETEDVGYQQQGNDWKPIEN